MTDPEIRKQLAAMPDPGAPGRRVIAHEDVVVLKACLTSGIDVFVPRRDADGLLAVFRDVDRFGDGHLVRAGDHEFRIGDVVAIEHLRTPYGDGLEFIPPG